MFRNAAAEFVYVRTYSRWVEDEGRRETWDDTVNRYFEFLDAKSKNKIPKSVREELEHHVRTMAVMPSMRALWAAGPALERNNICGYNCSFIPILDLFAFSELLFILMCGTGVGFSVEEKYVTQLPIVKQQTGEHLGIYQIEDSKEGWADALKIGLESWFSGKDIEFDFSALRPRGARLLTSGGRSSGPDPLRNLLIFVRGILLGDGSRTTGAQGRKITSLECHDICCQVAEVVVVGGVRRSSLISLSDLNDDLLRTAKNPPFPLIRAMANNSVVFNEKPNSIGFLKEWYNLAQSGTGERGIFCRFNALNKNEEYRKSSEIAGLNPCAEILLRNFEFCNLSEVVIRSTDKFQDLIEKVKSAVWLGTFQSTLTKFKYIRPEWKKNCEEERLLGVSLTGQLDNPKLLTPDKLEVLREYARKVNRQAAKAFGISPSAAITCTKPSGCQTPDTMLITSKGLLRLDEIGDVCGQQWQDHNIMVAQEDNLEKSTKFYVNGKSIVKKLVLDSGVSLSSTLNHRYRVLVNGEYVWKQASDIQEGDIIPYRVGGYCGGEYQHLTSVNPPYFNNRAIFQPLTLSKDFAYLLGLYFGDGSNHKKGIRIAGDVNKDACLLKAADIAERIFAIKPIFYERTKGNNKDLYLNSTHLLTYLSANGLLKQDTYNVEVPLSIRKSPPEVIQAFIDGYVDADGCETDCGTVICTTSEKMAKDLPIIIRALGNTCSVKNMPPTKTSWGSKMRYRITITKGRSGNYMMDRKNKEYYKQLDKLGLSTLIPDKVVGVEFFESDTYDIEVPINNTFIANSYVSHNTVSQVVDSSSGMHPRRSPYYIRRYRISNTDPLFHMMRAQGAKFTPENGQTESNATTWVVSFPIKAPKNSIFVKDLSAIDQLKWYLKLQKSWTEHNSSSTIYVGDDEWAEVGAFVYEHLDEIIAVSFLPKDNGSYEQAPEEEITEEQYKKMIDEFPKIDYTKLKDFELEDQTEGAQNLACTGDKCELK